MNCHQASPLIDPYADGELDAASILELEQHLHDCPGCALALGNARNLKKALKQASLSFAAPADLPRRIKAELRSQFELEPRTKFWNWNWLTAALASAATACLSLLLTLTLNHRAAQQRLAQEIVSDHVRSLMGTHALDVASTDQHTVKPWFNGKLDFSPPVKDLAAQNFPLVGGRLDYVNGRTVAALVFQHQKHVINLFVWPTTETNSKPVSLEPIQGYHLIHWSEANMTCWVVSDLNESELAQFVEAFTANKTPSQG